VNAAKDGLLALSVGVGLGVLSTLMEVVGPKGRHDPDRSAVRHGSTGGEVTLGGRRVAVPRPRVRSVDGEEIELATYAHFADRDPLTRVVLEQMLAGVSTRRFERTREPVGEDVLAAERSASKSTASRAFVGRTGEHLQELMSRSLTDIRLAALMLDGIDLKGRCCVVALGVSTDGVKIPLGLWDGSTENTTSLLRWELRQDQRPTGQSDGPLDYGCIGRRPGDSSRRAHHARASRTTALGGPRRTRSRASRSVPGRAFHDAR
jgi:hypothetical protein